MDDSARTKGKPVLSWVEGELPKIKMAKPRIPTPTKSERKAEHKPRAQPAEKSRCAIILSERTHECAVTSNNAISHTKSSQVSVEASLRLVQIMYSQTSMSNTSNRYAGIRMIGTNWPTAVGKPFGTRRVKHRHTANKELACQCIVAGPALAPTSLARADRRSAVAVSRFSVFGNSVKKAISFSVSLDSFTRNQAAGSSGNCGLSAAASLVRRAPSFSIAF